MKPVQIIQVDTTTLSARLQTAEGLSNCGPEHLNVSGFGLREPPAELLRRVEGLGGSFVGPISEESCAILLPVAVDAISFLEELAEFFSTRLTIGVICNGGIRYATHFTAGEDPYEIIRQWYIEAATPGTKLHNYFLWDLELDETQRIQTSAEYRTLKRQTAIALRLARVCAVLTDEDFTPEQQAALLAMRDEARACVGLEQE